MNVYHICLKYIGLQGILQVVKLPSPKPISRPTY